MTFKHRYNDGMKMKPNIDICLPFFIVNFILGSRFKRVAVPIGLMSVGTSVCYPAQAVAVVKVKLLFSMLTSLTTRIIIFRV